MNRFNEVMLQIKEVVSEDVAKTMHLNANSKTILITENLTNMEISKIKAIPSVSSIVKNNNEKSYTVTIETDLYKILSKLMKVVKNRVPEVATRMFLTCEPYELRIRSTVDKPLIESERFSIQSVRGVKMVIKDKNMWKEFIVVPR